MTKRRHSIGPEALLIASIVAGCATPPPEEYRLSTGTTAADFLQEVRKAAALAAQTPDSPTSQAQSQLKAVYQFFSWQHVDDRHRLIKMLQGFAGASNEANPQQMKAVISGLEELSAQLATRDAAIDEHLR